MLRPKLPDSPPAPTTYAPVPVIHDHATACSCPQSAAAAPASRQWMPSVSTGAIAAVVVGGVVLTALLTAVAVSAISVAVTAVVLRTLLNSQRTHRS